MEQLDRSASLGTRLKLYVTDVAEVSALPSGVRQRWGAWEAVVAGKSKAERAQALREANYYGTGDVEDVEMLAVLPGMLELRRQKRQLLLQERMLVAHYRRNLRLADIQLRAAQRAARAAAARAEGGSSSAAPAAAAGAAAAAAAGGPPLEVTQRILQQLAARKGQHAAALGALEQQQKLVLQRLAEANEAEAAERAAALAHLRGRTARGAGHRSSSRSPARSSRSAATNPSSISAGGPQTPVARSLFGLKTPSGGGSSNMSMGVGGSPRWAARHAALRRDWGSRRMARAWRAFAAQRKTTHQLVVNFVKCGITGMRPDGSGGMTDAAPPQLAAPPHVAPAAGSGPVMIGGMGGGSGHQHMDFEEFAGKLQAPATLRATQLLLRRLEQRLEARGVSAAGAQRLLRQLLPGAPPGAVLARYPVRVFLCAYMVVEYPQVVFSNVGDVEAQLSARATTMLAAFEALLIKLLAPLPTTPGAAGSPAAATSPGGSSSPGEGGAVCPSPLTKGVSAYRAAQAATGGSPSAAASGPASLGQLLVAWDDAWMEYLDQFAVWKGRDASGLEAELIRMAAQLERSLLLKLRGDGEDSARVRGNPDLQALIAQVHHDTSLLRERVGRLTGAAGRERLAAALAAVRAAVEAELEEAGSDASWDSESVGSRSRPSSRLGSRSPSVQTGLPDMAGSDPANSPPAATGPLAAATRERGSPPPSPPRSPMSEAGRGDSEAGAEGAGLGPSNQQMVWEMLYDPTYSLSTTEAVAAWQRATALAMGSPAPAGEGEEEAGEVDMESLSAEALTALLTRRAHMIAERAFWDSIAWRLQTGVQGGGLPQQLGPLLSELGLELGELLGDSLEGEALTQQFGERALMGRLTSRTGQQGGGANLTAVAGLLEQLMKGLVPLGGGERSSQVAEAAGTVQRQLLAALAAFADGGAADNTPSRAAGPLAEALTKALRLLMTQLKLVKLEAANTRLAALAAAMKERGAVVYLRTKLAKEWGLPTGDTEDQGLTQEVVGDKLPKTAAWVAEVLSSKLGAVQQAMGAAGLLLPRDQAAAAVAAAAAATPVQLRAGLRSPTGGVPPRSPGSAPPSPAGRSSGAASGGVGTTGLPVVYPADLDGWRGVTRLGLVSLVTGDAPAVGPALPELLQYDKERLHKAQNDLQQLLVLAGSLLIVQQLRAAAGRGWDAEGRAAARRRLMVVLADPNMRLGHLVTEISALAGATDPATESQVRNMFTTIVNPDSSAFKALRSNLALALTAHLLLGKAAAAADGPLANPLGAVLARAGAGVLAGDVAELAGRLARVAGVVEGVFPEVLQVLASSSGQAA